MSSGENGVDMAWRSMLLPFEGGVLELAVEDGDETDPDDVTGVYLELLSSGGSTPPDCRIDEPPQQHIGGTA
ncbi:hypothetical protein [Nocardia sp. N2S4-5]|uniref:hypothetical protein n=1 Tax=Nocardia sp. N2S4-5 TaxID=3351565 RepID=UPI0037D14289